MARYNLTFSDEITNFINSETKRLGMNPASFITMCLLDYRKQNDSILTMSDVIEQLSKNKKESE